MNLLLLYAEFFKIGIFSVGGGLATLPFLYELADKYEWLTRERVADFLAIAQSSPGAIGVNMAAQTGFQGGGIPGSFLAALGLISPAIIVIAIIARVLTAFKANKIIARVFSGLRPAAAGLLAAAGFGAWKLSLYSGGASVWYELIRWREGIIFVVLSVCVLTLKGLRLSHPVLYIAIGAAAGVLLKL
ncbi:MAG: chromate transporter [Treponema sp.]|jgi:chromate transporter|nr:chromate transporter [Treponema sp.]